MHRDDGARARRDDALDARSGDVLAVRIHVREYRGRPLQHRSAGRRHERARRDDDLVSRADSESP